MHKEGMDIWGVEYECDETSSFEILIELITKLPRNIRALIQPIHFFCSFTALNPVDHWV